MFGKKKELEAAIKELKAKLSEQEALNARLEQTIEEYKRKEGAIATRSPARRATQARL